MRRFLLLLVLLLLCLAGFGAHAQPAGCTTTTCTGFALPSGYLSTSGNQFVNGLGQAQRLACAEFKGAPNDGSMPAIRAAGFNCLRMDWRDALLGNTTFDDEFTTAPWLTHETWASGDKWSFVGTNFHTGTSQGPTWWANPIDTTSAAPVYGNSGGKLQLGLIQNPGGNGIANTTLGALINNQLTPGGNVQLFGYTEFSVAVPATPGFLFQWDEECLPATCTDSGNEIDVGIWTNGDGSQHVRFGSQSPTNVVWFETTSVNITNQNVYGIDWESDFITFYINGTQVAQQATPGGEFKTAGAFSYFLTSDATYFGYGPAFTAASATAQIDYLRQYTKKPTATGTGCNSTTDLTTCVANANTAGLKVVLSHRGNEIPTGTCQRVQANGLWFDSGGSSGGSDGCQAANSGNYTYAQFKADTVALLQQFNSNSTVIGYEMHHQPLVQGSFTGTGGGPSGGGFTANNGQIFDPNGVAWVARGFSVTIEDMAAGNITPHNLQTIFPRVNYVRISNFLGGGYTDGITPGAVQSAVTALTNLGIRVEFSDYAPTNCGAGSCSGGQGCRSGSDLSAANAWYQRWSAFYASNQFVTWESQNECQTPGWQDQVSSNYYAVHRAPIWVAHTAYAANAFVSNGTQGGTDGNNYKTSAACTSGTTEPTGTGSSNDGGCSWQYISASATTTNTQFVIGLADGNYQINYEIDQAQLNLMSNVVFDGHPYAGSGGCGGSAATCGAQQVAGTQVFKALSTNTEANIPMIMGEVGDGVGNTPDGDGLHSIQAVFNNMSTGGSTSTNNGIGYWLWFCGQPWNSSCLGPDIGVSDTLVSYTSLTTLYPNDPEGTPQYFQGAIAAAPGAGPTPASGGGGGQGANPAVNWGGGGDTDVLAACEDVGAAVAAVNSGVIEFCPGPANNAPQTSALLSGATKPAGGGNGLSDLSNAVAHRVVGTGLAGKVAYSVDVYPTNISSITPDSPISVMVPIWNAYFGSAAGSVPVANLEVGCSCDGSNGSLTDDQAFMAAWVTYANGLASGGPTFTTTQQPISNDWLAWGNFPGTNPNGVLNTDGTTLKIGQQNFWSSLLFGTTSGPPPPPATTWNPGDENNETLSGNNLIATSGASGVSGVRTTTSKSTGKFCWQITATTISTDWGVGVANSAFNLTTGLSGDANGMGFFPGHTQLAFYNGVLLSSGSNSSISGDTIVECHDFDAQLDWVTDTRMVTDSGAGAWNNSGACNPTVAACGLSTSGLTCPCFAIYSNREAGVATLVSLPTGFATWDNAAALSSGRPIAVIILGSNDNHRPASNDNAIRVALNNRRAS